MFINEYGSRDNSTVILLAPMMISGSDLYGQMSQYFQGSYHTLAPDQGGHGGHVHRAGGHRRKLPGHAGAGHELHHQYGHRHRRETPFPRRGAGRGRRGGRPLLRPGGGPAAGLAGLRSRLRQ